MKKIFFGALLISLSVVPQLVAQGNEAENKASTVGRNAKPKETTGDDIFQANCQRCHMPPMSISPRITGTIIMHMRTRARLSREDEVKLLRFMAP